MPCPHNYAESTVKGGSQQSSLIVTQPFKSRVGDVACPTHQVGQTLGSVTGGRRLCSPSSQTLIPSHHKKKEKTSVAIPSSKQPPIPSSLAYCRSQTSQGSPKLTRDSNHQSSEPDPALLGFGRSGEAGRVGGGNEVIMFRQGLVRDALHALPSVDCWTSSG